MPRTKHIINVHTGTGTTEPSGANLLLGEIAVQHTPNDPAIWIKMGVSEDSEIYEKFIGETGVLNIFESSAVTEDEFGSLSAIVRFNEYVAALALNDLDRRIDEVSGNTGGGSYVLPIASSSVLGGVKIGEGVSVAADGTISVTGGGGGDFGPLSAATYSHVTNNDIHVTAQDKTTWAGKQDAISDLEAIRSGSLSGASAYTEISAHTNTPGLHLPEVESGDEGKVLKVVDNVWCASTNSIIYAGTAEPSASLGQNGDVYLQSNPVVIYETDGTTGLLGHNQNTVEGNWQLENLDLSAYKYLRCYFAGGTASGDATTPAVIVEIPLDTAAIGPSGYIGSIMTTLPFNRNREYLVSCAVDSTKTKFQVIHQNTLWDITASDANNNGRYLYKIEGYV